MLSRKLISRSASYGTPRLEIGAFLRNALRSRRIAVRHAGGRLNSPTESRKALRGGSLRRAVLCIVGAYLLLCYIMLSLRITPNRDELLVDVNGFWMIVSRTGLLMFDASTTFRRPSADEIDGYPVPGT